MLAKLGKLLGGSKVPVFVGLLGVFYAIYSLNLRADQVKFEISRRQDEIQIPDLEIGSMPFLLGSGVLIVLLVGLSIAGKQRSPVISRIFTVLAGILALLATLGLIGSGNVVPLTFIMSTALVLAVPIALGAMGGIMSERSGVTNIAIEAQILIGAFMAAVVSSITDSYLLGILASMLTASVLSMILAYFATRYLANQIVVGVVLNVLVIGVTNFLYQQWLDKDAANVNFPGTMDLVDVPLLSQIPFFGPIFFVNRVTTYSALLVVPTLWFVLFKTRIGLRARAVGEHPLAADTVGINVTRTRFWWVTIGGALAGLGGSALTIGGGGAFGREMSAGLGFIALAVVILGKWNPIYAFMGALLFGLSIILRIWINQVNPGVPTDFIAIVPYVVTVIAVTGFIGKSVPPKALAIPYTKG